MKILNFLKYYGRFRLISLNISISLIVAQNGGWTLFGRYGACSATCGGGTKIRQRTCTNPPPLYGGNDCNGHSTESISCNTNPCSKASLNIILICCFLPNFITGRLLVTKYTYINNGIYLFSILLDFSKVIVS